MNAICYVTLATMQSW